MTPRSITSAILAVGMLLGASAEAHSVIPIQTDPPSQTELDLLRLLSRKELTVETLSPLLSGVFSEEFGRGYRVYLILAAAVRNSSLQDQVVLETMSALGCQPSAKQGTGQCRAFRDGFSAAKNWRPKAVDLAAARSQLLHFAKENRGGHYGLEANYASALIDSLRLSATDILELFVVGNLHSHGSPAEDEALVAMGTDRLRSALGSAFAQKLHDSQGDLALVTQIRAIPSELLQRARELNDRYWPNFLDTRNVCVVDRWRADQNPPDQWTAWSQMLVCKGW